MDALYENWVQRWQAALDACQRKGGETSELVIMPPATPKAISEVEVALGQELPASFRRVILEFSSEVSVYWFLPNGVKPPEPYRNIFCGDCSWSLSRMTEIALGYQEWLKVFDIDDP